ncbi:MAG: hypothetical protein UHS41_07135 [Lachnospiraceae bacterium]|nr:hypothetical protein [Lachnospiraceae bacterium]
MEKLLPSLYKNYYKRISESIVQEKEKSALVEEYEEQTEEQIENYLEENGYQIKKVQVGLEDNQLSEVEVKLERGDEYDEIQVKKKLSDVYSLEESHINVES